MKRCLLLGAALGIGGCATGHQSARTINTFTDYQAEAILKSPDGGPRGRALLASGGGSALTLHIEAEGLPAGQHGVHLHAIGRCDAPDFQTAGPHWNPAGRQHGRENPQGAHEGDLPNIAISADGRGTLDTTISGATLDQLLDADGAALVIHANPDDYRTDPSGNSGGRIACGIVERRS